MTGLGSPSEEGFVLSLRKFDFHLGGKSAGAWRWPVASIYRGEKLWTNTNERHIYLIFQTPRVRISVCGRSFLIEVSGGCSHFLQENSRIQASTVCFHIPSTPLVTNHRTPCTARSILKQLLYVVTSLDCRLHCGRCLFTKSKRKYQFCAALRTCSHDPAKRNNRRGI